MFISQAALSRIRTLQGVLSFPYSQVAGLLQCRKGFIDATNGDLVGVDVEMFDGIFYELGLRLDDASCISSTLGGFTFAGSCLRNMLSGVTQCF